MPQERVCVKEMFTMCIYGKSLFLIKVVFIDYPKISL